MHYIGLGKRGDRSALHYVGLGKRKSALNYIGLGKKKSDPAVPLPLRSRYRADGGVGQSRTSERVARRGRRRVQLRRRWASSPVDPALLAMGISRK